MFPLEPSRFSSEVYPKKPEGMSDEEFSRRELLQAQIASLACLISVFLYIILT